MNVSKINLSFKSIPWQQSDLKEGFRDALRENKVVLGDVDTTNDFMITPKPDAQTGLYVPNAESIIPCLKKLTDLIRKSNLLKIDLTDAHLPGDPEFNLFHVHNLIGTPGADKIPETVIKGKNNVLITRYQDKDDVPAKEELKKLVSEGGVITVNKNTRGCFDYAIGWDKKKCDEILVRNEKAYQLFTMLKELGVNYSLVDGVATDHCTKLYVKGLKEVGIKPIVVEGGVKEFAVNGLLDPNDPVYHDVTKISIEELEQEIKNAKPHIDFTA